MNQSINTDSKNSKEPQQKYRLGTVSIKILGGLNRFYRSTLNSQVMNLPGLYVRGYVIDDASHKRQLKNRGV